MARVAPHVLRHKTQHEKAIYVPLPKQVELIEAVQAQIHRWILYGGAAGGSKSHGIRWLLYRLCLFRPGLRCLLLRRTYPELEKTHMREAQLETPLFGAKPLLSSNPPIVEFPSGSILEFGHCQDERNLSSFLSAQYGIIAFDELVTFEERMALLIASRCRGLRGSGFIPLIIGGTNPGGVGGLWVKSRWIDKNVDLTKYPSYDPDDYLYIPALLEDNPYIDESYELFLQGLDADRRRAYRYGDWNCFVGQYFREFDLDRHVRSIEIPPGCPSMGGLDWGYDQPGVMLWAVALPDGHLHIAREWVFRERVAPEVTQEIHHVCRDEQRPFTVVYADPAMWIRSGQLGESIAETMISLGLPLQRSHHERVNGWQRLRYWLRNAPDGQPQLTIDPDCHYLIRTLPALVHDLHRKEDVDTNGEDHAADALRYLLMGRPAPYLPPPKPEPGPETVGRLFQDARVAAESVGVLGRYNVR